MGNLLLNPNQNPIPVPPVNSTTDGAMTPNMLAQLNDAVQLTNFFIYVDSTNGNDNNPGTLAAPLATLTKAFSLIPASWHGNPSSFITPVIKCAASAIPYALNTAAFGWGPIWTGSPVGPGSFPLTIVGDFTNEQGTRTETAGSLGNIVTDNTLVLTVDQYRGGYIRCTSGANAGALRMITANTINGQFSLNSPLNNPIAIGDTFIIQLPAVTIEANGFLILRSWARIGMLGINLTFDPAGFNVFALGDNTVLTMGACTLDMSNLAFFAVTHNSQFLAFGFPGIDFGILNPDNPFSEFIGSDGFQSGVYMKNSNGALNGTIALGTGDIAGFFVSDNCQINPGGTPPPGFGTNLGGGPQSVSLDNPNFRNSSVQVGFGGILIVNGGNSNGLVTVRASFDGSFNDFTFGGDTLVGYAKSMVNIVSTDINNSQGNAVRSDSYSSVDLYDVSGTGNTGVGLQAQHISAARFDGTTTVTGAGGDTLVGTTPKTYAAIGTGFDDGFGNRINPTSAP